MIRLTTTTALVTCLAAPLMADVTTADIWNGFKAFNQATGLKVDATQTQVGNTTTISDLKFSGKFPFDLGSITISTAGFDLVDNGDGTVDIILPDQLPIAVALSLPDDMFVTANLDFQSTGYTAQASGDPDNYTITYDIEKSVMRLIDISLPDVPVSQIEVVMTMENMAGSTNYKLGKMLVISQLVTGGKMEMDGSFSVKNLDEVDMVSTFSMVMVEGGTESRVVLPAQGIDLLNLPDQLRDGLALQFTSKAKNTASRNHITMLGETFTDQITLAEGTDTTLSLSRDGLKIDSAYTNYAIDYIMQELPFPIRLNFAKAGGALEMPLLKSDEEQDFSYNLTLDGATMDEELWALFDPAGRLPRDPATLSVDLTGKGRLFMDLLDFEALKNAIEDGEIFAEPTSLNINAMDFAAIGAKFTGSGMFTFDNDDYETFDGIPAPSGTASMHLSGLNSVIDKLMEIGLLGDEEALGIRMGLGLFTVVGKRKDTLVSEIEITPDGHISANGKRLK